MKKKENYYIITGGPGCGKTSIIRELENRKYNCVQEVGRKIIREQLEANGSALPWKDKAAYSDLMLQHSVKDYLEHIEDKDIYFYDRGIPDILGYKRLIGINPGKALLDACKNYVYNKHVFILPPWPEIYENDAERKQDFKEAIATYESMCTVYSELGYSLIEISKMDIKERTNFILNTIL